MFTELSFRESSSLEELLSKFLFSVSPVVISFFVSPAIIFIVVVS